MKAIINPIDKKLLKEELTNERFVRLTNNGDNEIYIINHHNSPNVMLEVGRLRELTFREAGGGTGKEVDIDEFDTAVIGAYEQLIVWNPREEEIVGGYRFIRCDKVPVNKNIPQLATNELFIFSEKFISTYMKKTIELGRSFVQPQFQPTVDNRKGLFSLDNLWDGLGALVVDNPDMEYFFGKVTMYRSFNLEARDMILSFMNYFFPDNEKLITPMNPLPITTNVSSFLKSIDGLSYKDAHKILNQNVRALGEHIPPLVNAYMNLSSTMKSFGTGINSHFGDVEETGIMVTIADIYDTKKERHIKSYLK